MADLRAITVGEPDASPISVPEAVIHEIWRLQQFRSEGLTTVDGRQVVVFDPGKLNDNQGPDFLEAQIQVDTATWFGSVEIHKTSADWERHGHHLDPHYAGVILHVTLAADRCTGRLKRKDGTLIPEVVLYPRLKESLRKLQWEFRKGGRLFFACHDHWMSVPETVLAPFLDHLARNRIRRKAARIGDRFIRVPDLEQILYEEVLRCLGYVQNAEAMVLLARLVPLLRLRSQRDPGDGVALLLGAAGLFDDQLGSGPRLPDSLAYLSNRYALLAAEAQPARLPNTIWRRSRLRPANDPVRRIVQSGLLFGVGGPLSRHPIELVAPVLEARDPARFMRELLYIAPDVFAGVLSTTGRADLRIGIDRCATIVANAVLPILYLRAEQSELPDQEDQLISTLRRLPVVMDHIVRRYSSNRGRPTSMAVAQGLHELSRSWCSQGRCRKCAIWKYIVRPRISHQQHKPLGTGGNSHSAIREDDVRSS